MYKQTNSNTEILHTRNHKTEKCCKTHPYMQDHSVSHMIWSCLSKIFYNRSCVLLFGNLALPSWSALFHAPRSIDFLLWWFVSFQHYVQAYMSPSAGCANFLFWIISFLRAKSTASIELTFPLAFHCLRVPFLLKSTFPFCWLTQGMLIFERNLTVGGAVGY